MKPERILVTGGAGFIGSHTVDALLASGRQVVVLDNLSSGKLTNLPLNHPDLSFIEGDVLEYPLVLDLMRDVNAVLHLAAIASVPQSIDYPAYTLQVNTLGLVHVLQAVRESGRAVRVVYASSASVYGDEPKLPCNDERALAAPPLSPYALQKLNCEQYADLYQRLHGQACFGLRYFNVYGSRQDPHSPYSGVISRFLDAYHANTPLTLLGDGLQSRDFIHVSDVARANLLALDTKASGVVNVATGQPETLVQLIDYIQAAGGRPAAVVGAPARAGDIRASYATTALAERLLQFTYRVPLKNGIAELVTG
jgi:UDP-glucose 4-epimerase